MVEMRRTTRVFGARVLRSGRRLFATQEVFKHMRRASLAAANAEEGWIKLLDHGSGGGGDAEFEENEWHNSSEEHEGTDDTIIIDEGEPHKVIQLRQSMESSSIRLFDHNGHFVRENRRWGLVYSRKRMRDELVSRRNFDKKFRKKFSRKQSTKTIVSGVLPSSVLLPNINTTKPHLSINPKSKKKKVMKVAISKLTCSGTPILPPRNGVTIYRGVQKSRSSLRSRKLRNPSKFGNLKSTAGFPFFPVKTNPVVSKSIREANYKELKDLTQDVDSASCNASILVIESDRCHREVGAVITMEMLVPKQWFLVVKRNGVQRFQIEALNVMRPCFCNRVTHAIIWVGSDESRKLEFSNRQDWFVFKELYRKCSERTTRIQTSLAGIIPVPRVNEVLDYADANYVSFKVPDFYIRSRGDEVSRTLEKSDPVYDMDSDDDEWLNKFNNGRGTRVDEDIFEKIIDAFEKGSYCSSADYSDVTMAVDRCLVLASKDVLEAVYGYWIAKRKEHSALVRVFQFYKPKIFEQLNFKSVLRKKRSFRQCGTRAGRGKQLTFLKASPEKAQTMTGEAETENATAEVEERVMKRQRAQLLMKVADLLTYKAATAVKIAESRATYDYTTNELFLLVNSLGFT